MFPAYYEDDDDKCIRLDQLLAHSVNTCFCGACDGAPIFFWKADENLAMDLAILPTKAVMN